MHTMRLVVAETLATPGNFWPLNTVSLCKSGRDSRRIAIVYEEHDDKLINCEILRVLFPTILGLPGVAYIAMTT